MKRKLLLTTMYYNPAATNLDRLRTRLAELRPQTLAVSVNACLAEGCAAQINQVEVELLPFANEAAGVGDEPGAPPQEWVGLLFLPTAPLRTMTGGRDER